MKIFIVLVFLIPTVTAHADFQCYVNGGKISRDGQQSFKLVRFLTVAENPTHPKFDYFAPVAETVVSEFRQSTQELIESKQGHSCSRPTLQREVEADGKTKILFGVCSNEYRIKVYESSFVLGADGGNYHPALFITNSETLQAYCRD